MILCLAACAERRDAGPQAGAPPESNSTQPTAAPPLEKAASASPPAAPVPSDGLLEEAPVAADTPDPWLVPVAPANRLLISPEGLGPIRFGMTFADARSALPGAKFARGWDGEGVPFVDVTRDGIALMSLHADDDDADAPFNWSRRIDFIQSFSPAAATADGVAVGDLVADVEKAWGPVREISVSEIESREFVRFARQPGWLDIRIDYSGDFQEGARATTRYKAGARIMTFMIAPPAANDDTP
jgi:hypothetical protein